MQRINVCNAFSLNMLPEAGSAFQVHVKRLTKDELAECLQGEIVSHVGHESTARIFSEQLGVTVPMNRSNFTFNEVDNWILVGQYFGPRLEEGVTTLPDGAKIAWSIVYVLPIG